MNVVIRRASVADVSALVRLVCSLGYDVDAGVLSARLRDLPEGHAVLVAERGARVVGFVHVHLDPNLMAGWHANLGGLAIDETARDDGVDSSLLEAAEAWAREHGCHRLDVRSGEPRTGGPALYREHQYEDVKRQLVLAKQLVNSRTDVAHP